MFVSQTASGCGGTVHWIRPDPVGFQVDNPASTCVDDGGQDAPADTGTVDAGNWGCSTGNLPAAPDAGSEAGIEGAVEASAAQEAGFEDRLGDALGASFGLADSGLCDDGDGATTLNPDAAACFIDISKYDRSCSVDSDCVAQVPFGCSSGSLYVRGGAFCERSCNCPAVAVGINRNDVAQYLSDISMAPVYLGQIPLHPPCSCPDVPPSTLSWCGNGVCWGAVSVGDAGSGG
jgi:hypothetical protein